MRKRKRACCGMSGKWVVEARRLGDVAREMVKRGAPIQAGIAAQRAASAALDALALERVHKALVLEASHCGEVAIVMLRCGDIAGAERMACKAAGFGLVALAAR